MAVTIDIDKPALTPGYPGHRLRVGVVGSMVRYLRRLNIS